VFHDGLAPIIDGPRAPILPLGVNESWDNGPATS